MFETPEFKKNMSELFAALHILESGGMKDIDDQTQTRNGFLML